MSQDNKILGEVYSAMNVPTYEEWLNKKNNGGQGGAAYSNYINAQNNINAELDRQKTAAKTNFDLARSTYGAEGEAMRSAGLTGGHSDYLDSKAYASYMGNIASAEKTAADNKVYAEQELYKAYGDIYKDEKAEKDAENLKKEQYQKDLRGIYAKLSTLTADELNALRIDKAYADDFANIESSWLTTQKNVGNSAEVGAYLKLNPQTTNTTGITEETIATEVKDKEASDIANNFNSDSPSDLFASENYAKASNETKDAVITKIVENTKSYAKDSGDYTDIKDLGSVDEDEWFKLKLDGDDDWVKYRVNESFKDGTDMYKLLMKVANNTGKVEKGEPNKLMYNGNQYIRVTMEEDGEKVNYWVRVSKR